eukprot:102557_1
MSAIDWTSPIHKLRAQLLKLSKSQLIKQCKEKNLRYTGDKKGLVDRLLNQTKKSDANSRRHNEKEEKKSHQAVSNPKKRKKPRSAGKHSLTFSSMGGLSISKFRLTWQHIANAVSHELYHQISLRLMTIIKKKNILNSDIYNNNKVKIVLSELKRRGRSSAQETEYIKMLIKRAKSFKPQRTVTTKSIQENDPYLMVDPGYPGLTMNLLYDIYSTHKSFIFSNYQFQTYSLNDFIKNLKNTEYISSHNERKKIEKIKRCMKPVTKAIDSLLYPQYVIDDDMYIIWQFIFSISETTRRLKQKFGSFNLQMFILFSDVISIYDEESKFSAVDIGDISEYLRSKQCKLVNHVSIRLNEHQNVSQIGEMFDCFVTGFRIHCPQNAKYVLILDRREANDKEFNDIYIAVETDTSTFDKLYGNYILSLQLNSKDDRLVSYLYYGLNENNKIRFYPEHLTSIVPRLFRHDSKLTSYEFVSKLYDDSYRHGFSASLVDETFNKYYKSITEWTHISVNYNRNNVKDDYHQEIKNLKASTLVDIYSLNKKCNIKHVLNINSCEFIKYIIESLTKYRKLNYALNNIAVGQFDLNFLSACYAHIINVHLFCLNKDKKHEIKQHILDEVGECKNAEECQCLLEHCTRRDQPKGAGGQVLDISGQILKSYLNSLHCYVIHDSDDLYRMRRIDDTNDILEQQRFVTQAAISDIDKIDELIHLITQKDSSIDTKKFMSRFLQWLETEEFDWDAIKGDMDCDINNKGAQQSNLFLFFAETKKKNIKIKTDSLMRYISYTDTF